MVDSEDKLNNENQTPGDNSPGEAQDKTQPDKHNKSPKEDTSTTGQAGQGGGYPDEYSSYNGEADYEGDDEYEQEQLSDEHSGGNLDEYPDDYSDDDYPADYPDSSSYEYSEDYSEESWPDEPLYDGQQTNDSGANDGKQGNNHTQSTHPVSDESPPSGNRNTSGHNHGDLPPDDPFTDTRMSFGDHLMELRGCIIKSLYGFAASFIICLIFGKQILVFVSMPVLVAMKANGINEQLKTLSGPEALITYVKVSLISGIFLASPWIFHQIWGFVSAGLYEKEKKYINIFVPFSAGLFVLGGVFFFIVVAPISFNFFIRFTTRINAPALDTNPISKIMLKVVGTLGIHDSNNTVKTNNTKSNTANGASNNTGNQKVGKNPPNNTPGAKFPANTAKNGLTKSTKLAQSSGKVKKQPQSLLGTQFTLQKYISLVAVLALAFGLAFQTPLVVLLLGRLSIVSLETLKSARKYVLFIIVIVAAILTPPDVVSQIALAVPMYLLYEVGVLLLRVWPQRK